MKAQGIGWRTAWQLARRDLNARFRGLRLLLVCLFLGTGALAAIGTLTSAIERELAASGGELLGGDIQVSVWQRDLNPAERAALAELGRVSGGTRLQAVARAGDATAPIELKAVDAAYPLYGRLTLTDGRSVGPPPDGAAWAAQGALDRLGVAVGDRFRIGTRDVVAAGVIANEPDRLGEGFQLGPTVIVAQDFPASAGLLAPGSQYRSKYRVAFDAPRDRQATADALEQQFPTSGIELRTSDRASPGADRFITQMSEFLLLVGLAALIIAGIGIGGGVASYLEDRRQNIATLKVLGATSGDIARIYGLQIAAAALVGSLAGLAVGVAITPLLARALSGLLPVQSGFVIDPVALLVALAYGMLVALVFAATPLTRARHFPAMALMRARVAPLGRDRQALLWVTGGLAAIVVLALLTSSRPLLSGGFLAGAAAALGLIAALALAIKWLARRLPTGGSPLVRNALANLSRPGANIVPLVTALGFGLSAFVLLAAIQTSIDGNIQTRVPDRAPDYFVLDIPPDHLGQFETVVRGADPAAELRAVPNMRGAVVAYGPADSMTRVADLAELPEGAWALRGERGLTYADAVPPGNRIVAGDWWGADYAGEPAVSVDEELADAIGLKVGDYLTVAVLGVERRARVASLRQIDWDSLGFNHVLVFSPNTLRDAPHTLSATISLSQPDAARPLLQALVAAFPASSVIEVGQILTQARDLLGQVGLATLAAASVAVLAGLAVLLGAIAAARAARMYDTVILRVLGADRRQILLMQLVEYAVLVTVLAVVALLLGSGIAWAVVTQLFEFDWLPDWPVVLGVLGLGLVTVFLFALGGALPLLRAKPAAALRTL
ncbi:ABC transporter permease [Porphyrobacter sp. GA68]|uniref:ABC transporter permease n=1 Tax=Porphyrobacter sp. GA68 TaxID=2883480 RepID=UPI001D182438|nr:FtsX-like permease family protein [Porphyrobacter sp. GA68]